VVRYDLYRATENGTLRLSLPLALNDPAGEWTVQVSERLSNTEDTARFTYRPVTSCSIAAGATPRAVHHVQDRDNVFRFFRTHQDVTIVKGTSEHNNAAAERLVKILQPWNVRCKVVNAADVNKPRVLSEEEAKTWVGLQYSGSGQIKPGDRNSPALVGFAVQGPVILLGTPEDNPLIKTLADQKFLPFAPAQGNLPGPGRGYVSWQRDAIGVGQESITLIAHDAKGMSEAVGTLYDRHPVRDAGRPGRPDPAEHGPQQHDHTGDNRSEAARPGRGLVPGAARPDRRYQGNGGQTVGAEPRWHAGRGGR
jgi:hypothetical protein